MPMHVDWCLWNFSLFSALAGIRFIWVRQQDPISRARLQVDTGRLLSRVPLGWWICLVGNPSGRKPSRFASCERVWCHDYQGHSFRPPRASQSWTVAVKSQGTYQAYNQDYSQNVSVSAWTWLHMIAHSPLLLAQPRSYNTLRLADCIATILPSFMFLSHESHASV
jgi:hypothetical protein